METSVSPKWLNVLDSLSEHKQQQIITWLMANKDASREVVEAKVEEVKNASAQTPN